ncbi:glycosyltransferase family 2 protein [Bacteroidota bacterium]
MEKMQHTFVLMGYGESEYIGEAYEALKNQTVKSHIIMTSSTPNDYQESFAKKHDIPFIINPDRRGFAGDLNFAYASAETDFVSMVHQDDLLMPEYTEMCIKNAIKYENALIVFTNYLEYSKGKMSSNSLNMKVKKILLKTHYPFKNHIKSKLGKRSLISFGNPISCPSIFYVKKNIGEFKFLEEYKVSPEWEALVRLAKMDGRFVFVKKPLHAYRVHEGQITSVGLADRKREDKLVFNILWPKPIASILINFYAYCYMQVPKSEE